MDDKDNDLVVVNKDGNISEVPVSMQLYQAIYNNITGKTEKITDTYNRYYKVALSDVINLERRVEQFCEQYHIKEVNSSITIFHVKGSKERFSSFERLNTYNVINTNSVERINIELNFLIILPKVNKPQNYKVTIMLTSGLAIIEKHGSDMPKELPISMIMRAIQQDTAKIEIEYVDYIVARSISELFREWIDSLPEVTPSKSIEWWQSKSHFVRQLTALIFFFSSIYFASKYAGSFLDPTSANLAELAKYLIYSFSVITFVSLTGSYIGRRIEKAIDSINSNSFSCISFNAGDKSLLTRYDEKKKGSKNRLIKEILIGFAVGVCSSLLASYLIN